MLPGAAKKWTACSWHWWLLAGILVFWGVGLWPEARHAGFDLNDLNAHESLTRLILADWRAGGWGIDGWHDRCCLGSPIFRTYQPLGHLLAAALTVVTGWPVGPVLHGLLVLALLAGCLAFYAAARLLDQSRATALGAAALSLAIRPIFTMDHSLEVYLFNGAGLFTQALAVPFFALAVAFAFRLAAGKSQRWVRETLALGVLFSLTFGFQILYGYLLALVIVSAGLWGVVRRSVTLSRLFVVGLVVTTVFLVLNGYLLWSLLADAPLSRRGEFDPRWRWDGWGLDVVWAAIIRGVIWDDDRRPIFELLTLVGALSLCRRGASRTARGLLPMLVAGMWLLAGRTALGSLNRWLPGIADFPLERANGLTDIAAIFLAGIGFGTLCHGYQGSKARWRRVTIASRVVALVCLGYLATDRWLAMRDNTRALRAQQQAMTKWDPRLFTSLEKEASRGWLRPYRLKEDHDGIGQVPYYCVASRLDMPQLSNSFYNGTYPSEAVYYAHFDQAVFQFLDITGAILPNRFPAPPFMEKVYDNGVSSSYRVPTEGPFSVIAIPRAIVVAGEDYENKLGDRFFYRNFRADNSYSALVPKKIAQHWPSAVPKPTTAGAIHSRWGEVIGWENPQRGVYHATLRSDVDGAYGMLRQSYHPRWEIRVNGHEVTPQWGTPGLLVFALDKGLNEVTIRFPPDKGRTVLFWLALAGYCLAAAWALARVPISIRLLFPRPALTSP